MMMTIIVVQQEIVNIITCFSNGSLIIISKWGRGDLVNYLLPVIGVINDK